VSATDKGKMQSDPDRQLAIDIAKTLYSDKLALIKSTGQFLQAVNTLFFTAY
jgi:hypothetical protein